MIRTVAELAAVAAKDPEALLVPGEVAALFRVHPKTPGRWATAGMLPVARTPGRHRRFRAADVLAALGAES